MTNHGEHRQRSEDTDTARESDAELTARFQREVLPMVDVLSRGAWRMARNGADAEDLVQDTLMHAYAGFRNFEPGTNVKAWLFRILSNQFINAYRKKQRRPQENLADEFTDQMLASGTIYVPIGLRSAESEVLEALPDDDIRAVLESLPEELRAAVYYADVEGFSYREIAATMDIPLGTVMSRLHRGRNRLRTLLFDIARDRGLYREQLSRPSYGPGMNGCAIA